LSYVPFSVFDRRQGERPQAKAVFSFEF